jgi:hypothetical protein
MSTVVIVIAYYIIMDAHTLMAIIISAKIVVITIYRYKVTSTSIFITNIICTGVIIIAYNRKLVTVSFGTEVICTQISIITIDRSVHARTGFRRTMIVGTSIVIITNYLIPMTTTIRKTG